MNDPLATFRLNGNRLICGGEWTASKLGRLPYRLFNSAWPQAALDLDLSEIQRMGTAGAWLVYRLCKQLRESGRTVELHGLSEEMDGLLKMVETQGILADRLPKPHEPGVLEALGRASLESARNVIGLIAFLGQVWATTLRLLVRPTRVRWCAIAYALGEAGYKALPIVGLLSFLLGIVITYQGGVQLRTYGASVFVADLVGLSTLRELAPIITAIIVAGRTGSAYTAQIGTMKVTEEIDALRSIGIQPLELLVLVQSSNVPFVQF